MSYESEIRATMNAHLHERCRSDSHVRSLSCPPSAHVSQEEKYVLNPQYDIRCHESYTEYYQSADTEKKMHLPPPLDMNPEIVHSIHARQSSNASQCPGTPTFEYLTPLSTLHTSPLTKSMTPETELSNLNRQNSSDGTDLKNSSRDEYDIMTPSPRSEEYMVQRAEKCVPSPPAEEYSLMTPSPRSEEYSIKTCAKYSLKPFSAEKYKGMKNPHAEESAVKTALEDEKYGGSIMFSELTKKANRKHETSEMNDTAYLNLSGDETTMVTLEQSLEYSFSPVSIMSDLSPAPSYPHLLWSEDAEDYHEEPCPQDAGYAMDSSGHDCVKNTTESNTSSQFHARRLYSYSASSLPHIKWNVNGRLLLKIVNAASPEALLHMTGNVRKEFPDLMMDAVGHFLCQSIIGVSSGVYLTRIIDAITQSSSVFANICFNWHGTHSMQTLLETVSTRGNRKDMKKLCRGLFPLVSPLVMNAHGNHIIQKCLTLYVADPSKINYGFSFIFDVMADNMLELGRDRFGCVILQRCMQIGTQEQKDNLAEKACENCVELMQDPFGNYVVQYLLYPKKLDVGERPQRAEKLSRVIVERANYVSERIKGKVVEMANQKYSSNAVELCVECSDAKHRKSLVKEMIASAETLTELLQNDYGNYVIQKALDVSRGDELQKLLKNFHPIIYGEHFEGQVQRLCMKLFRKYAYLQKSADSLADTEENTTDVKESPNKMGSIYKRKNHHRTWNAVIKSRNTNGLINVA